MTVRTLEAKIFGRQVSFEYSESVIGYSIVLLRILLGWVLLQAGIEKVLDPEWTAAGFLQFAIPEGNPFVSLWGGFAGNALIDNLVQWGQILTGIGLIAGGLLRWNAFWAAVMMIFFWMTSWQGGLGQGIPLEHGWVVDDHLIYAVLLWGLGAVGAGRILGADAVIEKWDVVKKNPWLKYILG
jgi:thiosulfate dehydrogenase [quinone] large subunit